MRRRVAFRRVAADPQWLTTTLPNRQADGTAIPVGTRVWYYPNGGTMLVGQAADDAANAFQAAKDDEANYAAGCG
jgi:hypothetical protein